MKNLNNKLRKQKIYFLMVFLLLLALVNPLLAGDSLMVYSGAGLRKPVDEIGEKFEKLHGIKVELTYGGSAQLLSQIELTNLGDVFIPGATTDFESAKEKGLIGEGHHIAYHIPVIAVSKGNPKGISRLEDLAKPGIKVILGDEKACAIGKTSKKILKDAKVDEAVEKNLITKTSTVNELIMYLEIKQADVSIVWEDNLFGVNELEMIEIEKEKNDIKTIPIGILKSTKSRELAQKFVDFVISAEGKKIFHKYGFKTID